MAEYIEREALIEKILSISVTISGRCSGKTLLYEALKSYRETVLEFIKQVPTADVVEVKHGEWSNTDWSDVAINGYMVCTQCNVMIPKCEYNRYCLSYLRYCPNCGAKMDGKGD